MGDARFDPAHELKCVERTYKVRNFWTISAMKSQKAAGHSQNKENEGLLCYKHKWLSFPALEINKSFLILIKAKYFYCMINPLLTKLVPSRWQDISLVYVFFRFYGPRLRRAKKELGQHPATLTSR